MPLLYGHVSNQFHLVMSQEVHLSGHSGTGFVLWQAQYFVDLEVQISWQGQCFVHLEVQSSLQVIIL